MIRPLTIFKALLIGFAAAACSPADDNQQAADTTSVDERRPPAQAPGDGASGISSAIAAAVANPARSEQARVRDAGRKPTEILTFFGVKPGMTVLDVGAGSGYYTEILDAAVGPGGKVLAQNTPGDFYDNFLKTSFEPLAERLANVEPYLISMTDIDLEDATLDAAFIFLIYHHMHYNPDEGEALPGRTKAILARIRAALKPGGILGIIEHAAPDGASRADSAPLHRVDPATTKLDITGQGFDLAAESDLLHFRTDDRSVYWRNTPYQGKTWRLVHKYVKPVGE
ncbi:MAG: methyltransferase domain-containing protein [Sphingomonadales bacterium]